ncbi:MAG: hypothetical protein IKP00_08145, partial [Victivallales bacterium]|nr:hypothetical protein [Victivallales bacterium]
MIYRGALAIKLQFDDGTSSPHPHPTTGRRRHTPIRRRDAVATPPSDDGTPSPHPHPTTGRR